MRTLLCAGFFFASNAFALAQNAEKVIAFEFFNAGLNATETLRPITGGKVSDDIVTEMSRLEISTKGLAVHCGGNPGPRFVQLEGRFFTLNGKSKRMKAVAITADGMKHPVIDSNDDRSPFSGHFSLVSTLIKDAEQYC